MSRKRWHIYSVRANVITRTIINESPPYHGISFHIGKQSITVIFFSPINGCYLYLIITYWASRTTMYYYVVPDHRGCWCGKTHWAGFLFPHLESFSEITILLSPVCYFVGVWGPSHVLIFLLQGLPWWPSGWLCSNARDLSSIPGQETRFHMPQLRPSAIK